jgi:glycosyltransferase involved in cell wall biosynthesis
MLNHKVFLSVILPFYNAEKTLGLAIQSILDQTYTDFELLLYNDGSTDNSLAVVNGFSDARIRLINLPSNIGLIDILNQSLVDAKGDYWARMDADDVAFPDRLSKQVDFLNQHTDCGICGTQMRILGTDEIIHKPLNDAELRWWIFKSTPFSHPTVMLKRAALLNTQLCFRKEAYVAEDYDMWWRFAYHTRLGNLPEVLLEYRIHPAQESSSKQAIQADHFKASQVAFCASIGSPKWFQIDWINQTLTHSESATFKNIIKTNQWFDYLTQSASAQAFFSTSSIQAKRLDCLLSLCKRIQQYHPFYSILLLKSDIRSALKAGQMSIISFLVKSLIFWKTRQIE